MNRIAILSLIFSLTLSESLGTFWDDYPELNGWKLVDNFGWTCPFGDSGWAYHEDLDFIFSNSEDSSDIWIYRPRDWLWTNLEIFPFVWSSSRQVWLYFNSETPPMGDSLGGGRFWYLEPNRWYWERFLTIELAQSGLTFKRKIVRTYDVLEEGTDPVDKVSYVYNIDEVIQYLLDHPKANGEPQYVLAMIGQSEFESFDYDSLSRDHQKELRRAFASLKSDYILKVFFNEEELSKLTMKYFEGSDGPMTGSGELLIILPDGRSFYFQVLWVS